MNQINLLQPAVSQKEIDAVTEVLKSGWWGSGPKVVEFEKKFAKFIGTDHCLLVNSCTSALHLALRVLLARKQYMPSSVPNIIVPSLTFVSTGLVGLHEGIEVRFADVDEKTFCINPESVKKLIDENTIAIIAVHYGGITAPIEELNKSGIPVIEDCAHATGNPEAGKHGIMSCWSFHPVKNLATGDMGAITYNTGDGIVGDNELKNYEHENLIQERWCGINADTYKREKGGYNWEYNIERMGFKYNTNDIMAAIGLVQLERISELNGRREEISKRYREELKSVPVQAMPESGSNHLFVIRVPSFLRGSLVDFLRENNISPGVHYKPIHTYPIWGKDRVFNVPITDKLAEEILSLPIHPMMTDEDQTRVIDKIKEFFTSKVFYGSKA